MHAGDCAPVPDFVRLRYAYGQMLGPADFQAEQRYYREKLKLHNRCLHGYGTVCGLEVVPSPEDEECEPPINCDRLEDELKRLRDEDAAHKPDEDPEVTKARRARIEQLRRRLAAYGRTEPRAEPRPRVMIQCGFALDCEGNELVVRRPIVVDILRHLTPADRDRVARGPQSPSTGYSPATPRHSRDQTPPAATGPSHPDEPARAGQILYVSICYCEQPADPIRPVVPDVCGAASGCSYGKVREGVRVIVTLDPPEVDDRCETCCTPCGDPCLLLARVSLRPGGEVLSAGQIDNAVRRMAPAAPTVPTVITGVSWRHDGDYSQAEARQALGTDASIESPDDGLAVHFSRPVLTETLRRGVVDLWVVKGGTGESAGIVHMQGDYARPFLQGRTTTVLRYQQTSGETLNEGDRVLVIVRADFILDECCRPVDGNHVGGRIPLLPQYAAPPAPAPTPPPSESDTTAPPEPADAGADECVSPPGRFGPWTSGTGTPGGTFESWFYVRGGAGKEPYRKPGLTGAPGVRPRKGDVRGGG